MLPKLEENLEALAPELIGGEVIVAEVVIGLVIVEAVVVVVVAAGVDELEIVVARSTIRGLNGSSSESQSM